MAKIALKGEVRTATRTSKETGYYAYQKAKGYLPEHVVGCSPKRPASAGGFSSKERQTQHHGVGCRGIL